MSDKIHKTLRVWLREAHTDCDANTQKVRARLRNNESQTMKPNYSKLSNDEILNLAAGLDSLTDDAQSVLTAELAARKLSMVDIAEYQNYLSTARPGPLRGKKEEFVTRTFNGCGTMIYGKTLWITILWVPVFPLRRMKLQRYSSPNRKRELLTALFIVVPVLAAAFFAHDIVLACAVGLSCLGLLLGIVWFLRRQQQ